MLSLLSNLIGYWPLHEASGARADMVGQAHNLTDNNTVTQNPGIQLYAGQFTAANSEYLSHADDAVLSTGDVSFTLCAWVYADSLGADRAIMSKWGAAGTREFLLYYSNASTRFNFSISPNGTSIGPVEDTSLGAPATATWYFIQAWHDSVNDLIAISSNLNTPVTAGHAGGLFDSANAFLVGASTPAAPALFWNGRICEAAYWKRVLTQQERAWLYNDGRGRTWPFDGRYSPAMLGRDKLGTVRRRRQTGLIY